MKKRKFSLLLNIATICLCVCAIAIGVYSAKTASLSINGSIGFTAHDCKVKVLGKVEGAVNASNESVTPTYSAEGDTLTGKELKDSDTWNIGSIFFDDFNCSNDQIATPIVFTFIMTNESIYYDVFAEFGLDGDLQTKLNMSIDFTSSVTGYDVLYTQDALCVLESDNTKEVIATITLMPKDASSFSNIDLSNFKVNFYKQPIAIETSTTGEYEYNNLIYTLDSNNSEYAIVKAKDTSLTGDIVVPPQIEIDGSTYKVDLIGCSDPSREGPSFYETNISTITLPNTVTEIGGYVFYNNNRLYKISIPNSVTTISQHAFEAAFNCIEIINKTNLDFTSENSGISSYTHIINDVTESKLVTDSNGFVIYLNSDSTKKLVNYVGSESSITIPNTISEIADFAFACNSIIEEVVVPSSVTTIDEGAFIYCSGLKNITLSEGVTTIHSTACYYCDSLERVNIPTTLSDYTCFNYASNIIFNDGTTIINNYLAGGCNMVSVTIPVSVTEIKYYAFYQASKLATINYKGTKAQWNAITKGEDWNLQTGNYSVVCTDGTLTKAES